MAAPRAAGFAQILPVHAVGITLVLCASAFVGVRSAGADYSPGALALGRQIVASIALTVMVAIRTAHRGQFELPSGRTLLAVLIWGVAWFAGYNLATNAAEQVLDAGTTAAGGRAPCRGSVSEYVSVTLAERPLKKTQYKQQTKK